MDEELDSLLVRVRADTGAFARDVGAMRAELEGPLARGAANAGRAMEGAIERFVRTGKLGFEDLRQLALSVLADIAGDAVRAGIGEIGRGKSGGVLGSLVGPLLGSPGRATGGPVTGGRAYMVGERGPEMFVPRGDGRVAPVPQSGGRAVTVNVNVSVPREAGAPFMARTGDQVARAVRRALAKAEVDG